MDADASDASDGSGQDSDGNYEDNDHSEAESAENGNEEEPESKNLTSKPAAQSGANLAAHPSPAKDLPPPYSLEAPAITPSEPKAVTVPQSAPAKDVVVSDS